MDNKHHQHTVTAATPAPAADAAGSTPGNQMQTSASSMSTAQAAISLGQGLDSTSAAAAPVTTTTTTANTATVPPPPPPATTTTSAAASSSSQYRQLNVKDALTYLELVKVKFNDQPEIYNRFLDIMKDFKSQSIDTPGVIDRVSSLFRGHPNLITGFNTFLPPGYRIEPTNNPLDPVKVITPVDAAATAAGVDLTKAAAPFTPSAATAAALAPNAVPASSSNANALYKAAGTAAPSSQFDIPSAAKPSSSSSSSSSTVASYDPNQQSNIPPAPPSSSSQTAARPKHNLEFNHAINYVNKIKTRFSMEPDTYKQFLEILQTYKQSKPIQEVYAQVQELFKGAPDLLDEFNQFLPDASKAAAKHAEMTSKKSMKRTVSGSNVNNNGYPTAPPPHPMSGGQYPGSAAGGMMMMMMNGGGGGASGIPPPKKKTKMSGRSGYLGGGAVGDHQRGGPGGGGTAMEELEFFDKVKKMIGNKSTYNEFLKILNLFSQEIIDAKVLIERVAPFLDKSPELFEWFKRFVKYEEDDVIWNTPQERPELDISKCKRSGDSYRQLPVDYPRGSCSGRDSHCFEVLNDDWMSHPLFTSENGHFATSKKNINEEAMHKCEEERYDFDLNIEANLHTIGLLEPIARQISTMDAEEKARFKLPPGLGGTSKTIYQRAIKKIYDKDRGQEIIDALHHSPAVAVPVVLKRLKQKDEEWKRAQREWNKIWREIELKNFYKSLDYQGPNFKNADKKATSSRALLGEIENVYREQRDRSSIAGSVGARYQFDFHFKDRDLFRDCRRIIVRAVDLTNAERSAPPGEKKHVGKFLREFVGRFFWDAVEEFAEELEEERDDDEEDGDDKADSNESQTDAAAADKQPAAATTATPAIHINGSGDSATNTATTVTAAATTNTAAITSTTASTTASTTTTTAMDVDVKEQPTKTALLPKRPSYTFYGNTQLYIFFRQFQILYSRLLKIKELSHELSKVPPPNEIMNPIAIEMGLQKPESRFNHKNRYSDLVINLLELMDGDIEVPDFEEKARSMFSTSAYISFTLDKLGSSLAKQILTIINDGKSVELMNLYFKEREKLTNSARQEAVYRLASEAYVPDENLFRMEFFVSEKVVTVQLIAKEDHISDDSISSEEKWSVYVDHFVQLSTTEGLWGKKHEPFLRRNLPSAIPDEPPTNVETKSGLELKICVNTYKIFFVDNTEDYFRHKRFASGSATVAATHKADSERRQAKFHKWLYSSKALAPEAIEAHKKAYNSWIGTARTEPMHK